MYLQSGFSRRRSNDLHPLTPMQGRTYPWNSLSTIQTVLPLGLRGNDARSSSRVLSTLKAKRWEDYVQINDSLRRTLVVTGSIERNKRYMRVINTLESRLPRYPDPLASPAASVSWGSSTPPGLLHRVSTRSSCCWGHDPNPTWQNIAEGVRVPSARTVRPRQLRSQRACASLFDVSD